MISDSRCCLPAYSSSSTPNSRDRTTTQDSPGSSSFSSWLLIDQVVAVPLATDIELPHMRRRIALFIRSKAATLVFAQLVGAFGGLCVNLLSTQALAPEPRGQMALFIQAAYVLQSLSMLGRDRSFLVGYGARTDSSVAWTFLRVNRAMLLALTLAASALMLLQRQNPGLWYFAAALSILFVCSSVFGFALRTSYIVGTRGAESLFLVSVLAVQLVLIAGSGVLLGLGVTNIAAWIALYPLSGIVNVLAASLLLLIHPRRAAPVETQQALVSEGWRLLPLSMVTMSLQKADRLLLPVLATASELGRYAFVSSLMELVVWPVSQWLDTQLRRWREDPRTLEGARLIRLLAGIMLAASIFASGTGVAAYLYIEHALPEEYGGARELIVPLGAFAVLKVVSRVVVAIQVAGNRSGLATTIELSGLLVSGALFFALTPALGAVGTAISLVSGGVVALLVALLMIRRK